MGNEKKNYGLYLYKILCIFLVIAFHFSDHSKIPLIESIPNSV